MPYIWLGALMILCGLVYMAAQAIWRGPLSAPSQPPSPVAADTLEPRQRGVRFLGLARNWPGLVLIALGVVLLMAGAGVDHLRIAS